jgi:type IV pilus assembly protein PilM
VAKPSRILSLNLGMQTVSLADFRTTPDGGLVLHAYTTRQLLADPAAEATRVAQIKLVIGEMLGEMKIKAGRVNYAIAAQSVFTRFVKLPTVDPDKIDQIVTFEAQQNVPFPIEEVVWDYQLVASRDESKIEVVLVAIKADLLDELNNAVQDSGLLTGIVDVAPMALYNAFRYNYADVAGCSLLLDIGARTTNLIFVEPNKVFSRSIPIGGTTFTANITREFSEPFGAAEERKLAVGFVSLGGAYAEPSDPDIARVSKIIRNSMTRLHAEITRSISFYRSQQGGSQPQQVFLCGGSVGLPYIREFFAEKLQMPIEFFNPLRNVTVAGSVDVDAAARSAHSLGELVGLAIRSASEAPMELNLEPASVTRAKNLARKQPFMILAGLCFLLSLLGCWLYFMRATTVEQQVVDDLKPKVEALKGVADRFDATSRDIDAARATAAPFVTAVKERDYWARIINDINSRLPSSYIWVTEFRPSTGGGRAGGPGGGGFGGGGPGGGGFGGGGNRRAGGGTALVLHGLFINPNPSARNESLIDDFAANLKKSPYVASVKEALRTNSDPGSWDFDYELQVELKEGIAPQ